MLLKFVQGVPLAVDPSLLHCIILSGSLSVLWQAGSTIHLSKQAQLSQVDPDPCTYLSESSSATEFKSSDWDLRNCFLQLTYQTMQIRNLKIYVQNGQPSMYVITK